MADTYDDWFPSNYWKAEDLDDGPVIDTITDIAPQKMQDGTMKPCVFFKENTKKLVLNVTNKNALQMMTRSKNPKDAIGLRIMLVQVEAEYQGKPCKAIRIRTPPALGATTAQKPQPGPSPATGKRGKPRKSTGDEISDSIPY